jgi:high-affinity Fe2+/Pb2+ permease
MTLMMSVALFVFVWGGYQFIANAASSEAQEKGKQHMLYGIIGLLVMVSAYAILRIAAGTFGILVP